MSLEMTSTLAAMCASRVRQLAPFARGASVVVLAETAALHGEFGSTLIAYGHSAEKLLPFIPQASDEVQLFFHGEEFVEEQVAELRMSSRVCAEVLEKAASKHRIAVVGHDGFDRAFFTIAVIPKKEVQASTTDDEFDFGID